MEQKRVKIGDWIAICCAYSAEEIKTQEQADEINRELEDDRSNNTGDTYFIFDSYEELKKSLGDCSEE